MIGAIKTKREYPFPNDTLKLLMELHSTDRLTYEEIKIINSTILLYLDLRENYLYEEEK